MSEYIKTVSSQYKHLSSNTEQEFSNFSFYEEGLVKVPVVQIQEADVFYRKCPNFWLYYTSGTGAKNCSNRLITNSSARTRVLGLQLYYYRATGFLHWGL